MATQAERETADAVKFFYKHAGWSYDPKTETPSQGRRRCARKLASAERWASANGYSFEWADDHEPFQCQCDDPQCESHEPHAAYVCICHNSEGDIVSSLCGISFGPGVEPWGQPYRRVVEAELALEARSA